MGLFKKKTTKEKDFYNNVLHDYTDGYTYLEWLYFKRTALFTFFIAMIILELYGLLTYKKELIVFCIISTVLGVLLSLSDYFKLKDGQRDYF